MLVVEGGWWLILVVEGGWWLILVVEGGCVVSSDIAHG